MTVWIIFIFFVFCDTLFIRFLIWYKHSIEHRLFSFIPSFGIFFVFLTSPYSIDPQFTRYVFMHHLWIIFLLIFGVAHSVYAQNSIDSLINHYSSIASSKDTTLLKHKVKQLDSLIDKHLFSNTEQAIQLIDSVALYYLMLGNKKEYYQRAYQSKGFAYAIAENHIEALKYYQAYAKVFKKQSDGDGYFLVDLGNLYYDLKMYSTAKMYYQDAAIIFSNNKQYRGLTTIYSNYALVAQHQNQLDSAAFYIEKTLELQLSRVKDTFQIAHTYHVLGRLNSEKKLAYAAAIPHYKKAIELLSDSSRINHYRYPQFIHILPHSFARMGRAFCDLNQLDSGFYYMNKSLAVAKALQQAHVFTYVGTKIGEEFVEQGEFQKAYTLLKEVEQIAYENSNQTELATTYQLLKEVLIVQNKPAEAISYDQKLDALQQEVDDQQDHLFVMNDLILQQEKNKRIQQQKQTIITEQKIRRTLLIFIAVILSGFVAILFLVLQLRKKNTTILQTAKALKEANETKATILGVIGHDLRAPLGAIMSYSSKLIANAKPSTDTHSTTLQLNQATKKAFFMMDGLMQWVSIQKEALSPQKQSFQLQELIQQVMEPLQILIDSDGQKVDLQLDSITLISDPDLLQVILRNLITNAIKHNAYQGIITIETYMDQDLLVLAVKDEGRGFAPEQLQQLFHSKKGTQIAQQGSGLGLTLVQELCQQLDINVKAQNLPVRGASFELFFPKTAVEQFVSKAPSQQKNASTNPSNQPIEALTLLRPYLLELQRLEIFESSAIQRILNDIRKDIPSSPFIEAWQEQLQTALYQNNEELYTEIINQ